VLGSSNVGLNVETLANKLIVPPAQIAGGFELAVTPERKGLNVTVAVTGVAGQPPLLALIVNGTAVAVPFDVVKLPLMVVEVPLAATVVVIPAGLVLVHENVAPEGVLVNTNGVILDPEQMV